MLLVGGYTQRMDEETPGKARGLSAYAFSPHDGRLTFQAYYPTDNPSFLLADPERDVVYVVHEHGREEGAAVSSVRVRRGPDGKVAFREISRVGIDGDDPCHATLAAGDLVVTCYSSGQVMILPVDEEGRIGEVRQTFTFHSPTSRGSHTHCSAYLSRPARLLVTDLGADKLRTLLRGDDGDFTYVPEYDLDFPEFHGPRHLAVHPTVPFAVVNGECKGRVHLLDLSALQPKMIHGTNVLPQSAVDEAHGAAIRFSPNGKIIFTTDRSFHLVNTVRFDQRSHCLRFRNSTPSGGEHPRDAILSPDGEWLLTANTLSNTVGVFRVHPKGELTHYHTFRKVPTPTAFAWW